MTESDEICNTDIYDVSVQILLNFWWATSSCMREHDPQAVTVLIYSSLMSRRRYMSSVAVPRVRRRTDGNIH